ncbi:hypothetical protein BZG36_05346 [Bifiguratus adelaidae]|uniref:snRNA-activating protein complex subunit 3 n=1 Tax=Bifiguratus adelaidae TaxID=1938954 RepID=A0A261XVB4_9FUNG|nr:hypothetical protein BZG36_05346 [Bifiguratus adelaidae]
MSNGHAAYSARSVVLAEPKVPLVNVRAFKEGFLRDVAELKLQYDPYAQADRVSTATKKRLAEECRIPEQLNYTAVFFKDPTLYSLIRQYRDRNIDERRLRELIAGKSPVPFDLEQTRSEYEPNKRRRKFNRTTENPDGIALSRQDLATWPTTHPENQPPSNSIAGDHSFERSYTPGVPPDTASRRSEQLADTGSSFRSSTNADSDSSTGENIFSTPPTLPTATSAGGAQGTRTSQRPSLPPNLATLALPPTFSATKVANISSTSPSSTFSTRESTPQTQSERNHVDSQEQGRGQSVGRTQDVNSDGTSPRNQTSQDSHAVKNNSQQSTAHYNDPRLRQKTIRDNDLDSRAIEQLMEPTEIETKYREMTRRIDENGLQSLRECNRMEVPIRRKKEVNYLTMEDINITKLIPRNRVDPKEVIIEISLYQEAKSYVSQPSLLQELQVLGSQKLTTLRDAIDCLQDFLAHGANQLRPVKINSRRKKMSNSYFFIENCFYVDRRAEGIVGANFCDYSETIVNWQKSIDEERGLKHTSFTKADMDAVAFEDLTLRINHPYLFTHQGDCNHLMLVKNIRMVNKHDVQELTAYPRATFRARSNRAKCHFCQIYPAEKVTFDDRLAGETPAFYCSHCYAPFHYDGDGKLVYDDYHVYPYTIE